MIKGCSGHPAVSILGNDCDKDLKHQIIAIQNRAIAFKRMILLRKISPDT